MSAETRLEWWSEFFATAAWTDFVDRVKPEEQTRAEIEYVRKVLGLEPGMHVLDAPCGTGRLGLGLAAGGCQVTGIDLQPALIRRANEEAARLAVPFTGREGDIRDLPWWDEFDGALCYWGSFGYFDEAGNRDFVEAVWRALKPGAPFLIDTHVAETLLPRFRARDWQRVGDAIVLEERVYDHERARIDVEWTHIVGGTARPAGRTSIRIYAYRELADLVGSCGFDRLAGYDTLTETPFSIDARRLTLVARKQA